jgi:hypothetical protein
MTKALEKFAHPSYIDVLPDYITIRDCFKGSRAIKTAGIQYLPGLKSQSIEDYDNYRRRALFFPITGKTVSTMVGLATVKPPVVKYPDEMKPFFVDTNASYQFTEFYVRIFTEVILMGRYGVLIDAPVAAQSQPKLVPYIAENIVRWDIDEQGVLQGVLLREYVHVAEEELFESKQICRYRHCHLVGGVYTVDVLDDDLKPMMASITPSFSGRTIDFVPFVPYGSSGVHFDIDKPPMLDIATINISHYLSSADLEWGRHLTGLPTPVVSGVDASTNLTIGGTKAWVLPPAEAKAYYMEFLGQGLQSLEKAMADKISLMASVSARMVDSSTRGSEAADTVRLRYMSESAGLIHVIGAIETGLVMMYNMLAKLMLITDEVVIMFSREILGIGIAFKDLKILFDAYLAGAVSKETLLYNLRRLDAVNPARTDAEELGAIRDPEPTETPTLTQ